MSTLHKDMKVVCTSCKSAPFFSFELPKQWISQCCKIFLLCDQNLIHKCSQKFKKLCLSARFSCQYFSDYVNYIFSLREDVSSYRDFFFLCRAKMLSRMKQRIKRALFFQSAQLCPICPNWPLSVLFLLWKFLCDLDAHAPAHSSLSSLNILELFQSD